MEHIRYRSRYFFQRKQIILFLFNNFGNKTTSLEIIQYNTPGGGIDRAIFLRNTKTHNCVINNEYKGY